MFTCRGWKLLKVSMITMCVFVYWQPISQKGKAKSTVTKPFKALTENTFMHRLGRPSAQACTYSINKPVIGTKVLKHI